MHNDFAFSHIYTLHLYRIFSYILISMPRVLVNVWCWMSLDVGV